MCIKVESHIYLILLTLSLKLFALHSSHRPLLRSYSCLLMLFAHCSHNTFLRSPFNIHLSTNFNIRNSVTSIYNFGPLIYVYIYGFSRKGGRAHRKEKTIKEPTRPYRINATHFSSPWVSYSISIYNNQTIQLLIFQLQHNNLLSLQSNTTLETDPSD